MNHTRAHISLLILALAVLSVVIAVNFYMHQKVGISVDHAVLAHDIVIAEQQNANSEQDLSQVYQTTVDARARLHSLFIPSDSAVQFIEALEGIGSQTGANVSLTTISADNLDSAGPGTIGTIDAHVSVSGPWQSVMRSLELIENLAYPVTVGTVTLVSNGSSKGGWQATFDVKTPILKE